MLDFQILIGYYTGKMGARGLSGMPQWPESVSAVMCMGSFSALSHMNSSLPTKSKFLSINSVIHALHSYNSSRFYRMCGTCDENVRKVYPI
jgi:hypothetical protein